MVLWVLGLSVVVALLRGGRPRSDVKFRHGWIIPAALAAQLLSYVVGNSLVDAVLMISSYLALVYGLICNAQSQSLRIVLTGVLLNLLVLAVNGGRLPVDVEVANRVGVDLTALLDGTDPRHVPVSPESRLSFLGDVIPIPWPVARVVSVGDISIYLGIFLLIQDVMGKKLALGVGTWES